jgi:hypothetical protein
VTSCGHTSQATPLAGRRPITNAAREYSWWMECADFAMVTRTLIVTALVACLSCSGSPAGPTDATDAGMAADSLAAEGGAGVESGAGCEAGTSACGAACLDLSTDPKHCGSCLTACAATEQCSDGHCCPVPLGKGVCDISPACGCSAAQNCARIDAGPEECVANGGIGQMGDCLSATDCEHGLTCAAGVCEPPCDGQAECATNYLCLEEDQTTQGGQTLDLGYAACEPHCNPVFPSQADASHLVCGTDQRCALYSPAQGQWVTYCANSTGVLGQGAQCTYDSDCLSGYDCVYHSTGTSGACQQFCRIGFSDCVTGSCDEFTPPAYDTNGSYNQEIGFCQ